MLDEAESTQLHRLLLRRAAEAWDESSYTDCDNHLNATPRSELIFCRAHGYDSLDRPLNFFLRMLNSRLEAGCRG